MNIIVKSALRVLEILDLFNSSDTSLSEKEISVQLNIPPSSLYHLLSTMVAAEYLRKDYVSRYKLGSKVIRLGNKAREDLDLYNESLPYLNKLSQQLNETIFLAYPSGKEIVYLTKLDCNHSIKTSAQPGANKPIYCTGLGKACLSFYSEEKMERLLQTGKLESITPNTIKSKSSLKKQLATFRNQGYAIDDEENEKGLYCVASPIISAEGEVIAAISCAGPKERMLSNELIPKKIKNTALLISKAMGASRKE